MAVKTFATKQARNREINRRKKLERATKKQLRKNIVSQAMLDKAAEDMAQHRSRRVALQCSPRERR